jgi:isocitrate dehydrogenase
MDQREGNSSICLSL